MALQNDRGHACVACGGAVWDAQGPACAHADRPIGTSTIVVPILLLVVLALFTGAAWGQGYPPQAVRVMAG